MPLLRRSWLVVSALIALVLAVLTALCVLQFEAILSALIRERLAILAQTTQTSFRSALDLGLPLETIRNAGAILEHARASDPAISAIHAFDRTGRVVHSRLPDPPTTVRSNVAVASNAARPGPPMNAAIVLSYRQPSARISGSTGSVLCCRYTR